MSLLLAAGVVAISGPSVATAATHAKPKKTHKKKAPTLAQKIQAAVTVAERSPDLWATVNQCASTPTLDTVGIRGQMPSLGYAATLSMDISVFYWNGSTFQPTDATKKVTLGKGTHGIHQDGLNFTFVPPAPGTTSLLRGTITFEWTIGTKVVGKVTRNTGHGYANVGFSNPPGFSAGTCTIM